MSCRIFKQLALFFWFCFCSGDLWYCNFLKQDAEGVFRFTNKLWQLPVDELTKDSVVDMQCVSICASSLRLRLKKAEVQQEAKMIGLLWKTRPCGYLRHAWLKLVKTARQDLLEPKWLCRNA